MFSSTPTPAAMAALFAATLSASYSAQADIVLSSTRVVYAQSAKNVTVNLINKGVNPLLAQVWLDDGREDANPQTLKLPFILTPPVSRLDPGKGQTVRITYLGQPVAQDRETLYWFNVLEVPPKPNADEKQSLLQLAFRTRIKLFFRPDGLKGSAAAAAGGLKWSWGEQGGNVAATIRNDSPYYVVLHSGDFVQNGKKYPLDLAQVAPFSTLTAPVKGLSAPGKGVVKFSTINDFGGLNQYESPL
ncbi:fimbrial chaperone [Chimaeribacter californicus]|uniref:Fimbrial chaperone n=1 Tax=Chimaeribacter californicus TaxID=2060067 RepID=A0A2N5EAA5_9GAMM|nr:fimbrial chaperone [Chimaeribacter californicus]PLR38822.1 fimbrial chaperone [Chimaeribacter californicus]